MEPSRKGGWSVKRKLDWVNADWHREWCPTPIIIGESPISSEEVYKKWSLSLFLEFYGEGGADINGKIVILG